jgi:hypothetical protein
MGRKKRVKNKAPAILSQPSEFQKIRRIWAENGVVRMEREPDGVIINLSVAQAAGRAQALNNMIPQMSQYQLPEEWIKGTLKLIERVIEVCREARTQIAHPNKKTAQLQNLLHGRNADGQPMINCLPEDYWVMRFFTRYHTLTKDEVRAVVRGMGDMKQAEQVIAETHRQRMQRTADLPLPPVPTQAVS